MNVRHPAPFLRACLARLTEEDLIPAGNSVRQKTMINKPDSFTDKDDNPAQEREESLRDRSARLEAEAAAMAAGSHDSDPLSPEPLAPGEDRSAEIDALQSELGRTKDQMVRALADAENARKRAAKDREDASKYAISSFAKDMIDVADNLRRALEAVPQDLAAADPRLSALIDGIEATERTLLKNLEKHGVKKIEPLHEIFDPNFHEVMFEASAPDHAAGTIIQMIETGYVLKDRLLRPARVGVAKDEGQGNGNGAASGQGTPPSPGGQIDTQA